MTNQSRPSSFSIAATPVDTRVTRASRARLPQTVKLAPRTRDDHDHSPTWLVRTCTVFDEKTDGASDGPRPEQGQYRFITAALITSLLTIGLVRFVYTPLLPDLIRAHWFSESDLITLSSAALLGFLVGASLGRAVAARIGAVNLLNVMNISASLSLLACAFPLSVGWFFLWRLIGGISSGVVVVLLAATILPHVSAEKRGIVGGAIFVGFGIGILSSGTVVPFLLRFGLKTTWLGLGIISSILTAIAWRLWPCDPVPSRTDLREKTRIDLPKAKRASFFVLFAFFSLGLASVMLFLSTYIARQLHAPKDAGWAWLCYGVGATVGPLLAGWSTSRFGGIQSVRAVLLLEAVATGSLSIIRRSPEAFVPAVVLGMTITGIVPLAQGWLRELLPNDTDTQNRTWSTTSVVYAATQMVAGYCFAWILNRNGSDYRETFAVSALALVLALTVALVVFRDPAPEATVSVGTNE